MATDKESRLPGRTGQRWGAREREGGRKRGRRRKGNVSPSAEQKNGVCTTCERGEIAFSFHFTRLPFPVQPSSFTSRPLLHTLTQTHTYTHAPRPHFVALRRGTPCVCVSVLELPPLILGGCCSAEHSGRPPVASQ